jgi:Protein of unknown function (DUF3455)
MLRRMIALSLFAYSILLLQGKPSSSIEAPAGTGLLLEASGDGSQVYSCTDGHWTLKAPDAKLLDAHGQVIGTHFAGPTWRLEDGSEVKGKAIASRPAGDTSSVPWLLVQAVPGSGSGKLANVSYIRRTETHGGAAPTEACASGEQRVPYTAKYSFYTGK